jgi:hypothetical protein
LRADDPVVVERVHLVVARPCVRLPDRLERRHALRQERPQRPVEQRVVDVERRVVRVVRGIRRDAADVAVALGAEPQARRVDHQRAARQRRPAREHEHAASPRPHRQVDAQPAGDLRGPWSRRVHEHVSGNARSVGEAQRRHARAGDVEADAFARHVACTARSRLAAERLQQAPPVEPAFAAQAQRPQREIAGRKPREALAQRGRSSSAASTPRLACSAWLRRSVPRPHRSRGKR